MTEYIDLLQGRIPKSVFAENYLKVEDVKQLSRQVLAVNAKIERDIIS